MKTSYPRCSDIKTLESLPDGTIVKVSGWALVKSEYGVYKLSDGSGDSRMIRRIPPKFSQLFTGPSGMLIGIEMHIKVTQVEGQDFYAWARYNTEFYYHEPTQGKCSCGAVHTFLPSHHSEWCDSQEWR